MQKSQNSLVRGRQLRTQLSILEGSLTELLRLGCCQLQTLKKARKVASFRNVTVHYTSLYDTTQRYTTLIRYTALHYTTLYYTSPLHYCNYNYNHTSHYNYTTTTTTTTTTTPNTTTTTTTTTKATKTITTTTTATTTATTTTTTTTVSAWQLQLQLHLLSSAFLPVCALPASWLFHLSVLSEVWLLNYTSVSSFPSKIIPNDFRRIPGQITEAQLRTKFYRSPPTRFVKFFPGIHWTKTSYYQIFPQDHLLNLYTSFTSSHT